MGIFKKDPFSGLLGKILARRATFTIFLVLLFCCLAFLLRVLPVFFIGGDILRSIETGDSLYLLRQVESLLANFPAYSTFDPMTFFPYGSRVNWGPVFAFFVTGACLITGAGSREEVARTAVLVGPLLATLLVPFVFLAGRKLGGWLCGMTAALFIAIMPGNFFGVTSFGVIDHHVAEALFGLIFFLCYLWALSEQQKSDSTRSFPGTPRFLAVSFLSGAVFVAGFLNMPTMVVFALVIAVFTLIQAGFDTWSGRDLLPLVILNTVVFGCALAGSLFYLREPGTFLLTYYSLGHPVVYGLIIAGSLALYLLNRALTGKPRFWYPLFVLILLAGGCILAVIFQPHLVMMATNALMEGFGQKTFAVTVIEARPLGPATLWSTYQSGLLLFLGGIALLMQEVWKKRQPVSHLCLVWAVILLVMTLQHGRYEYLLAAPFSLCAGYCVSRVVDLHNAGLGPSPLRDTKKTSGHRKAKPVRRGYSGAPVRWQEYLFWLTIVLSVVFVGASVWSEIHAAPPVFPSGWKGTLEWVGTHTPDPGVEYDRVYSEKEFHYPKSAYGIMSWWDYGHMITFFPKRIPNTNPFQEGLKGRAGAPFFFMAENETAATRVLDRAGSRYVITDFTMVSSTFWAVCTWYDPVNTTQPYILELSGKGASGPGSYQTVPFLTPAFFGTALVRLHLFDGSSITPGLVDYVEFGNDTERTYRAPPIRFIKTIPWDEKGIPPAQNHPAPVTMTGLLSRDYLNSSESYSALTHFRLVYESPEVAYTSAGRNVSQVKIFEYVKGARIPGNGTVSIELVTNTGRRFTFTEESRDGSFTLPYATGARNGGTVALGPYRIFGTNQTLDVSEADLREGSVLIE